MSGTPSNINENEKLSLALNEIFSNPQMLSAISSMAQNLKNSESSKPPEETTEKTEKTEKTEISSTPTSSVTDKLPELLNMLSSNGTSGIKQNRRSELLCALKPYLSQSRSDAIDKIIRFSELSSVFKNLT